MSSQELFHRFNHFTDMYFFFVFACTRHFLNTHVPLRLRLFTLVWNYLPCLLVTDAGLLYAFWMIWMVSRSTKWCLSSDAWTCFIFSTLYFFHLLFFKTLEYLHFPSVPNIFMKCNIVILQTEKEHKWVPSFICLVFIQAITRPPCYLNCFYWG